MAVMRERSASMGSVAAILESARPRKGLPQFYYLSLPGDHSDKIRRLKFLLYTEERRIAERLPCSLAPGPQVLCSVKDSVSV